MRFGKLALAAIVYIACTPAAHAQITLDFENLSNPSSSGGNPQGNFVVQNGFTLTATTANNVYGLSSVAPNGSDIGLNYTGSVALFNDNSIGGVTTLYKNNGTPLPSGNTFTLNSIDIANRNLQIYQPGGVTVVFTGYLLGGGTVTQSFTHGANNNLEFVSFDSNFTNLISVSFDQNSPFNQFDNIVLDVPAAVPEPGFLALLAGLALTGAAFLRRRKQARHAA